VAASRSLRRLLRVLNIEEEQCRLTLEAASAELTRLERALAAAHDLGRFGRRLVLLSAETGETLARLAGLEETHSAERRVEILVPRIADAEERVEELRLAFLAKRVECRQVETLIRETEAGEAIVAGRRSQQALDDWYLNRLQSKPQDNPRNSPDAAARQLADSPTTKNT
jgi:hypothetical protein